MSHTISSWWREYIENVGKYLFALVCTAIHSLKSGRICRIKHRGGGGAADTASTWNPSNIIAGVYSQEQGLGRGSNLSPDNVSWVLSNGPARGNWDNRLAHNQAGQVLEPSFVPGLHLEDIVLP